MAKLEIKINLETPDWFAYSIDCEHKGVAADCPHFLKGHLEHAHNDYFKFKPCPYKVSGQCMNFGAHHDALKLARDMIARRVEEFDALEAEEL